MTSLLVNYHNISSIFTEEKFWVGLGSVVTTLALVYTITLNLRASFKSKSNLKRSLEIELITNVNTLFSNEVDRPLLFDAMHKLRNEYVDRVKDRNILGKIQKLYLDLEHYSKFVEKVYLTGSKVDRRYVTELQLKTCNQFLTYFDNSVIDYDKSKLDHLDIGNAYIEGARDEAIRIKEENLDTWFVKLKQDIQKLI